MFSTAARTLHARHLRAPVSNTAAALAGAAGAAALFHTTSSSSFRSTAAMAEATDSSKTAFSPKVCCLFVSGSADSPGSDEDVFAVEYVPWSFLSHMVDVSVAAVQMTWRNGAQHTAVFRSPAETCADHTHELVCSQEQSAAGIDTHRRSDLPLSRERFFRRQTLSPSGYQLSPPNEALLALLSTPPRSSLYYFTMQTQRRRHILDEMCGSHRNARPSFAPLFVRRHTALSLYSSSRLHWRPFLRPAMFPGRENANFRDAWTAAGYLL